MCDQQRLRSVCAYEQSNQSLCKSLEYSMKIKLLTEHHLEFLSLKGGCTGSSESPIVKIPHCWKSHVAAKNNKEMVVYIALLWGDRSAFTNYAVFLSMKVVLSKKKTV